MNNPNAWLQLVLYVGALLLITKPLGLYLVRVLDSQGSTFLDWIVKPFERVTYRVCGINPREEQGWIGYTVSMLAFSMIGMLWTYFILRFQDHLPLNPQGLPGLAPHLAFNTAASFTTNTNWQSYTGESTMSYFSQMVALAIHNFTSAACGHRDRGGPRARHRPPVGQDDRQLLGRCGARHLLPARADLHRVRPLPCLAGHDPELQAVHGREDVRALHDTGPEDGRRREARHGGRREDPRDGRPVRRHPDDRPGADGLADRDQDARHERRRLHQRQCLPSLREPDPALQFPPDPLDLRHPERADLLPRPDGEEPAPRLGRLGRHVRDVHRRRACVLEGRGRAATRSTNGSGSRRRTATWRARRCASGSSIPRSLPR
jgi:hypothetical protein